MSLRDYSTRQPLSAEDLKLFTEIAHILKYPSLVPEHKETLQSLLDGLEKWRSLSTAQRGLANNILQTYTSENVDDNKAMRELISKILEGDPEPYDYEMLTSMAEFYDERGILTAPQKAVIRKRADYYGVEMEPAPTAQEVAHPITSLFEEVRDRNIRNLRRSYEEP